MKYAVCRWPDAQQMSMIVSVCRTFDAAKKAANKSDRLFVVPFGDGEKYCRKGYRFRPDWRDVTYMIPPQNDPKLGYGRYGHGLRSR